MVTKYVLPALAALSGVNAASCSITTTSTIVNPAGASAYASCTTFSGDVVMATGVAQAGAVDISGNLIKHVGSLTYENDNTVTSFTAGQLQSVGDFTFNNLSELSSISMPALNTVGDLDFEGLNIPSLGFGGVKSAGSVRIINTNIADLSGLDQLNTVSDIVLSDNQFLGNVTFMFTSIKGQLEVDSNDKNNGGQSVALPNLVSAGTVVIRNSSSLMIPKLSNVTGSLGLYGNNFDSVAFNNLSSVGALVLTDNSKLGNVSFPALTQISSSNATLLIANNTKLEEITGFPKLATVKGNVNLYGDFSKIDLPALLNEKTGSVTGAFDVETSSTEDVCSGVTPHSSDGDQVIKGETTCHEAESDPGSASSTQTATGTGPSSTSSSGAAIANVQIPLSVAIGSTSIFAGLLQLIM